MPNRILREGILTSERVNSLTWEAEVFYRRLMSVVDDFGRFTAHPSLLRAALFPLKLDTVRDANMERLLALVEQARLVRVYEVAGKRYLELLDFKQQVRAKESKFPSPEPPMRSTCLADAAQVPSTGTASAPVFGDEDGDVEEPPPPPAAAGGAFDRFWSSWPTHPRKVGRDQCRRKWAGKGCDAIADQVLAAVEAAKASTAWRKDGGEFIPSPLVWLNQARWEAPTEAQAAAQAAATTWQDTRSGIEAKGEELGIGRWDQDAFEYGRGEPWPHYQRRVFDAAGAAEVMA